MSTPHRLRATVAFAFTLVVGTTGALLWTPRRVYPDTAPATAEVAFASEAASIAAGVTTRTAYNAINEWYDIYATSRIRELVIPVRDGVAFGPWTAPADFATTEAAADGSVTEWADEYYICHEWSEYGRQFLSMLPGDTVTVNGRTATIVRVFDYPKASYLNEIRHIAGDGTMVLQTCVPQDTYNRIVIAS